MFQAAHEPITGARELGDIRVYNETAHAVTTMVTSVLPLAQGTYAGGGSFRATGATSETYEYVQHEQMGLSWPDGTWRAAIVHFTCDVPASSDKLVTFQLAQTSPPTFALHADVLAAIAVGWPLFTLAVGVESVDLFHQPGEWIEATPLMRVLRFRGRVPNTPFWGELLVQFHHNQRHARWWLWYGNSWIDDPLRTSPEYTLPGNIALGIQGARCFMRHESIKQYVKDVNGSNTVIGLIQQSEAQGFFPDGCGQGITGVLQFGADPVPTDLSADAETWRGMAIADVQAVGTEWRAAQAFGPFGHVLPRPPWVPDDTTYRSLAVQRAAVHYADGPINSGGPWTFQQYGCNPSPGNSGAQADFGVCRHQGVASCGHPAGLKAAQRSAYQEFNRPNIFRFADVSLWSQATRPTFMYGGRPHRTEPACDMLGKERRDIAGLPYVRNKSNEQWRTHSFEHYSMNDLTFYALLSGDRLARALCNYRCDIWMAENTYPGSLGSEGSSRNSPLGVARARGRQLQAGAQLLLVTGRSDFEAWITTRFTTRELTIWSGYQQPWESVGFARRDYDYPRGIAPVHWKSWEEMQAVQGYGAIYALLGITQARTDALRVAKSAMLGAVEEHGPTSATQRYRLWPNATWSAPGNPPFGTVVTCGAGTGRIAYYWLHSGYDGYIQLYDCTGTWGDNAPIVASTGAQIDFGTDIRYREPRTWVAFNLAFNGGEFLTAAQLREFETLLPSRPEHPFRNIQIGPQGNFADIWNLGAVLLCRQWAQETGDAVAEAAAQAVLDNWLPARGAPGDDFLDEGENAWSQWAGVVADPWA